MIRLKVKEIAEAKRIGLNKLSRTADINIKTIRKIFRNPTEIITTETLDKLAAALEVHAYELFEYTPNQTQDQREETT